MHMGHFELVRFLLDHSFDVNQAESGTGLGKPALQSAAGIGREDILGPILEPKYKCELSGDN